jgi:hypothetical protein
MRLITLLLSLLLASQAYAAGNDSNNEYLYYRDLNVPAYQSLREFFDLPNRPGKYQITLISDSLGPLTFRIIRAQEDHETVLENRRSYRLKDHEFHMYYDNPQGKYDLIVEIANSNPTGSAKVSVIVTEPPKP